VRADTALPEDVAALFAEVDTMGRLDALAYSGGITGKASPLADAEPDEIGRVIAVNLTGAMLCAREAIARMSTARGGAGGAIVFLSSRASDYGSPGEHVWYAASKGGVDSLTRGLAREVGKEGIRVNAVSPGPVATEMLDAAKQERAAALSPSAHRHARGDRRRGAVHGLSGSLVRHRRQSRGLGRALDKPPCRSAQVLARGGRRTSIGRGSARVVPGYAEMDRVSTDGLAPSAGKAQAWSEIYSGVLAAADFIPFDDDFSAGWR
jgi:hypothetical protein